MKLTALVAMIISLISSIVGCANKTIEPMPTTGDVILIDDQASALLSYEDTMEYIDNNITSLIDASAPMKAANGQRFADGYGFTSPERVYVDFEDGHYLYRALLQCVERNKAPYCTVKALFEKKQDRAVVQWEDSQKNKPIVFKWAKWYDRVR